MEKLNYTEFKNALCQEMNNRGFRVEIREVSKVTNSYEGLAISLDNNPDMQAVFNLGPAYDEYVDYGINSVIEKVVETIKSASVPNINAQELNDFASVKDKIFFRLSAGRDLEFLNTIPHRDFYGLTISYHVCVDDSKDVGSALITNEIAGNYGVTERRLFEIAKRNTKEIFKPTVGSMMTVLCGGNDIDKPFSEQVNDIADKSKNDIMFVLGNNRGAYGATTLLYDGVLDQIADAIGDFYILPSSIHEVIILPDGGGVNADSLRAMVREINNNEVKPEERLSYNVYHYNARRGFTIA